MIARELIRRAGAEIAAHKVRSALTCLSVAVGVAAILHTLSTVQGQARRLRTAYELSGPGRLQVQAKRGFVSKGLSPGLTWADAEAIGRQWPELYMVYPMVRRRQVGMAFPGFNNEDIVVWATTQEWRKRDWVYELHGRFLNDYDVRQAARVCVFIEPGGWVEKPFWAKYFPEQALEKALKKKDLLGKTVRLGEHLFTVVGILKEPPRDKDPRWMRYSYGGSGNVLVPITTYHHALLAAGTSSAGKVDEIQIDTGSQANAGLYLRKIERLLAARHRGEADFEIRDYREIMAGRLERMRQRAMAILVIGVVAILAGGIGIMNVTLATLFSRIREIGVRRALGATRGDILWQFVAEAVWLGAIGGAAGVVLGLASIRVLSPDPADMAPVGAAQVAFALLLAMGTGFLFSLFPAYKASRLDPVEALRYE